MKYMEQSDWIRCPVCGNKTRDKIRKDTVLLNYPLFCPKCKNETLVNIQDMKLNIVTEPDAKPQRRVDAEP